MLIVLIVGGFFYLSVLIFGLCLCQVAKSSDDMSQKMKAPSPDEVRDRFAKTH
ncbi:MAG: hypothetical protein WCI47_02955 [bacterium]